MTAKEYLTRYRDAYREAQDIELQMTQLRLKYALPTAIKYSDMPKAHNTEHDLSDYMVKMDALTDRLVKQYCRCMGIEVDILDRIERMVVESERERQVLKYRYTFIQDDGNLLKWEEVASKMNVVRMTATRIHGIALLHFPMDNLVL